MPFDNFSKIYFLSVHRESSRSLSIFKCIIQFVISVFALYYIIHMNIMDLYTTRRSTSTMRLLFQETLLTKDRQKWVTECIENLIHPNMRLMATLIQICVIIIARLCRIPALLLMLGWSTWVIPSM